MKFSYWENKEWFANNDFVVVGSGIVGLNCAIQLKKMHRQATILVLEKGILPQGASTKNAGFACFGSVSELLSDLKTHSKEEVFNLVKKRWNGLQLLRKTLGDSSIDFQHKKGYELFLEKENFDECESEIIALNNLLLPLFGKDVYSVSKNDFQFQKIVPNYIVNQFEGQVDTGKMMSSLLAIALKNGIRILNSVRVDEFVENKNGVILKTQLGELKTSKLFIATNGFANQLLDEEVVPARAQVLITNPIPNLQIEGTFHLEEGYYYFRNIDNRILLGGGRNLDFKTEETVQFGQTQLVQNKLEELLKDVILPNSEFQIEHRWSGIMGVGNQKKPIVKQQSKNVFCGIRLGGMGVAIGSMVGKELADLLD